MDLRFLGPPPRTFHPQINPFIFHGFGFFWVFLVLSKCQILGMGGNGTPLGPPPQNKIIHFPWVWGFWCHTGGIIQEPR